MGVHLTIMPILTAKTPNVVIPHTTNLKKFIMFIPHLFPVYSTHTSSHIPLIFPLISPFSLTPTPLSPTFACLFGIFSKSKTYPHTYPQSYPHYPQFNPPIILYTFIFILSILPLDLSTIPAILFLNILYTY